ncbi:MAG: peptidylprolyl isomerase [Ignavibacteriales bacterium]|nr:peptidylprolyl isomerase [Ignavibacteriales bacterium]
MRIRISLALIIITSFIVSSCSPEHSKIVIAEFGKDNLTLGEFENAYAKNVGGIETAKKDSIAKYINFLDLYVNFKMKLRDASVRGYNTDPALSAELNDYKEKVGISYLIEKQIVEPGIKKLYDQRKYEMRVSHIMIRPDSVEEKSKTLAYQILDSLKLGKNWNDMAKKYSADQYSKNKGGDIYWLTAGMIIPEFEDAFYNTEIGKVNPVPVKTRYGWHIIKVTEKRERIPQVRASHILIDFRIDSTKTDSVAARKQIEDIKNQLNNGADFAELAKKYSEDPSSKENGGDLGFIERRMMVPEFDEAAFNLKKGEVSNIVRTNFGYHLIKVTDTKPYPSFEDEKENLKKLFKKTRYDKAYADLVSNLKVKYNLKLNENTISFFAKNIDSTKVGPDYWKKSWRDQIKDAEVYSYAGKKVIVDTLFSRMEKSAENNKLVDAKMITAAANKDGENSVLAEEANNLDKSDPQFASLMDDYKNGIHIFKLQDDEVWSKVKIDSVKLLDFYTKNKDKYNWTDRVKFQEIFSRKDSLINVYYDKLTKGESFDTLATKFTERPGFKEKAGMYDLVDLTNPIATEANNLQIVGSYSKPFKNGGGWSIVKLIAKEPARTKTFEEAKAEVSGQFQESESKRLENEYIAKLKSMYKPEINYSKLEEAFKTK